MGGIFALPFHKDRGPVFNDEIAPQQRMQPDLNLMQFWKQEKVLLKFELLVQQTGPYIANEIMS